LIVYQSYYSSHLILAVSLLVPVVTPFEKFKAQYPHGTLIADLVLAHEGQYVVRAAVMNQGETLATGLAASADVQVAEDRARERAIALLWMPSETDSAAVDPAEPNLPMDEEDLGPPIDAIEETATAQPSAAMIALENFTSSVNPVDLSDVIAQTDVELTRLGWTSAQGREYLEKAYGKRSRQQLTDDELMSFLLHLEEQ
jgi:hypothetical protein